jgi:hypothetical protein
MDTTTDDLDHDAHPSAAGGLTKVVSMPMRAAREGINRAVDGAQDVGSKARGTVAVLADRTIRLGSAAREVAVSGRDATLERAEAVARREGAAQTAERLIACRFSRSGALTRTVRRAPSCCGTTTCGVAFASGASLALRHRVQTVALPRRPS